VPFASVMSSKAIQHVRYVLPAADLERLRRECTRLIDERDRELDRLGVDTLDLDHRGSRYFVHAYGKSAGIESFLRSDLFGRSCPSGARRQRLPVQRAIRRQGRGARHDVQLAPGLRLHPVRASAVFEERESVVAKAARVGRARPPRRSRLRAASAVRRRYFSTM
jgi:hypothetical protein